VQIMLDGLLLIVAALIAVPLLTLCVESVAALFPRRPQPPRPECRPRCAVLVPAHDEESSIGKTIHALLPQINSGDRLIVIADNCTDRTAEVARACGATVVERFDPERRGKGFAVDHGVRFLQADPPEVVVLVDADSVVDANFVDSLVHEASLCQCPVQSCNLVALPPSPSLGERLAWFAFRFKNLVRPLGLSRLGLPCLLSNGCAFPWTRLRYAPLATGNVVEDMKLSLDLAIAGKSPRYCPEARVSSEAPRGSHAVQTQRRRWEHGHLRTLLTQSPRLFMEAVRQRRVDLFGLALELSVPPLSLLFLIWGIACLGALLWWGWGGNVLPAAVLACAGCATLLAILAAWVKFGRQQLPLTSLLLAPIYVLRKLPIYVAFILRPERMWVRTARSSAGGVPGAAQRSV
jgi:cellulose synthase/poly-beta-1,6-N-acetylglucosamine synthase-like glycosyltransferase